MIAILMFASLSPAAPVPKDAEKSPIVCTAKRTELPPMPFFDNGMVGGWFFDDGNTLEVTLTNTSKTDLTLTSAYGFDPFVYPKVVDEKGKELSFHGYRFFKYSLVMPERKETIAAGASVKLNINLFDDVLKLNKPLQPGKYKVTVIFQDKAFSSSAKPIEVEIK